MKLLEIHFKNKNSVFKEPSRKHSVSFIPKGIKQHQISEDGTASIYVLDKYTENGMEADVLYTVNYFVVQNVWESWFNKETHEKLLKELRCGKVVMVDYDRRRYSIEKIVPSDSDQHIHNSMINDIKNHVMELEENNGENTHGF